MIEKEVFKELNKIGLEGTISDDLIEDKIPVPQELSAFEKLCGACCGLQV